eukprot:CAMPEP_0203947492 /NCGR_PEP_ID=MMETSP0359-20131031/82440_1 /ASSEMBLY_ACC=CAM_ASM_000338 /TAXON_ID=268821 /ORGANISM="Scrippsiella Hangoei, Strain SHTV-5" /LENGTH=54 /DNA_ID=CAMNT_0050878915 /DNA_START=42 /DNA_END=206 /DNA_ORIENTATION=-
MSAMLEIVRSTNTTRTRRSTGSTREHTGVHGGDPHGRKATEASPGQQSGARIQI